MKVQPLVFSVGVLLLANACLVSADPPLSTGDVEGSQVEEDATVCDSSNWETRIDSLEKRADFLTLEFSKALMTIQYLSNRVEELESVAPKSRHASTDSHSADTSDSKQIPSAFANSQTEKSAKPNIEKSTESGKFKEESEIGLIQGKVPVFDSTLLHSLSSATHKDACNGSPPTFVEISAVPISDELRVKSQLYLDSDALADMDEDEIASDFAQLLVVGCSDGTFEIWDESQNRIDDDIRRWIESQTEVSGKVLSDAITWNRNRQSTVALVYATAQGGFHLVFVTIFKDLSVEIWDPMEIGKELDHCGAAKLSTDAKLLTFEAKNRVYAAVWCGDQIVVAKPGDSEPQSDLTWLQSKTGDNSQVTGLFLDRVPPLKSMRRKRRKTYALALAQFDSSITEMAILTLPFLRVGSYHMQLSKAIDGTVLDFVKDSASSKVAYVLSVDDLGDARLTAVRISKGNRFGRVYDSFPLPLPKMKKDSTEALRLFAISGHLAVASLRSSRLLLYNSTALADANGGKYSRPVLVTDTALIPETAIGDGEKMDGVFVRVSETPDTIQRTLMLAVANKRRIEGSDESHASEWLLSTAESTLTPVPKKADKSGVFAAVISSPLVMVAAIALLVVTFGKQRGNGNSLISRLLGKGRRAKSSRSRFGTGPKVAPRSKSGGRLSMKERWQMRHPEIVRSNGGLTAVPERHRMADNDDSE